MSVWSLDPAHSQIEFSVKHMMVTTVRGRFNTFSADIRFDEAHPERSAVTTRIDAASIDTGMPARDAHLRSADFFDVERHPEIVFESTAIEPRGDRYRMTGNLTIGGQVRPVSLDLDLEGVVPNLQGGRRAAFSATTKISRREWGLTWNVALESGGWLVGDEIKIAIDLALVEAPVAGRVAGPKPAPEREAVAV